MAKQEIVMMCGDWRFEKNRWLFFVNNSCGSRVVRADPSIKFEDFVSMVVKEFGFEKFGKEIMFSYMLPKKILVNLPADTRYVIVGNNQQFQGFLHLCKEFSTRLCVTLKKVEEISEDMVNGVGDKKRVRSNDNDFHWNEINTRPKVANTHRKYEDIVEEDHGDDDDYDDDDEEGERFDYCDDSDGASSGDEDYSVYGRYDVEEEEAKFEAKNTSFAGETLVNPTKIQDCGSNDFQLLEMSALRLAVGQRYESKEALEMRLKILSVINQFDFDIRRSTTTLFTANCWVKPCTWRVRASTFGDSGPFFVRVYVEEHSCSITERSARCRQATYVILGQLYKDFVGSVGPTVLPIHVADALQKRYRVKVWIFLSLCSAS